MARTFSGWVPGVTRFGADIHTELQKERRRLTPNHGKTTRNKGLPFPILLMIEISCFTLRTVNYGNYGIFLIMGDAGFKSSTV